MKENEQSNSKYQRSEKEWKDILSEEQFRVLRLKGTEGPFSGNYYLHKEEGVYKCAGCDTPLFDSDAKFDSGCGWPSFDQPIDEKNIVKKVDKSHGMIREEIICKNCGGHLGHVFNDGPKETTGLRYCINSISLKFDSEKD